MLMASRLLYGMAKQRVLPPFLGRVSPRRQTPTAAIVFTTVIALGLIVLVTLQEENGVIAALGGTTSLLLLAVFTIVNVAVLKLRSNIVDRKHFVAPTILPILGALLCAFFVGPWTGRDPLQYQIAGWLLLIGVVLWFVTWAFNRPESTRITDPDALSEREGGTN
jgi:APA family basic amino acid/polyamine antiporter